MKLLISLILSLLPILLFSQATFFKYGDSPVLSRDTTSFLSNDLIVISDGWVIKEGNVYKMWYTCGGSHYPPDTLLRSRICYATSSDGILWNKYNANPVMDVSYGTSWDSLGVETASVVIDENAPPNQRYKMWYAGQNTNEYQYDIGFATSSDGIAWIKYPSPVLTVGAASEWDNGFLEGPSVILENGVYKMWYCGYDVSIDGAPTDGKASIGYATSLDGISWTKYVGNPVLNVGPDVWDAVYVQDPHVILDNGIYCMWYGGGEQDGYGQRVGLATSTNGINWTKDPANPILDRGEPGSWDANTASFPSVIKEGAEYKMWYTGKDVDPIPAALNYYWEIGLATSTFVSLNENSFADSSQEELTVFPNPNNGSCMVSWYSETSSRCSVTLVNQFGEVINETKYASVLGRNEIDLKMNGFASGIYFIRLIDGSDIKTVKVILH